MHRSPYTCDQFSLLVRLGLVMHTPQRPFLLVKRDITLPHFRFQSACGKFPLTPTAGKKTSFIMGRSELNYIGPRKVCFGKDQGSPSRINELINFNFWNRHNKPAAPLPDADHLIHDFFFNIPGKNEDIVRFRLPDLFRRLNGDMGSR
jgi:hypothetical protein